MIQEPAEPLLTGDQPCACLRVTLNKSVPDALVTSLKTSFLIEDGFEDQDSISDLVRRPPTTPAPSPSPPLSLHS